MSTKGQIHEDDMDVYAAYFYFISFEDKTALDIAPYEYFNTKIPILDINNLVRNLSKNHLEEGTFPPRYSDGTEHMFWRRVSYLIFATDKAGVLNAGAVKFKPRRGSSAMHTIDLSGPFEVTAHANGADRTIYALVFRNHMIRRDTTRRLKAGEREAFKFIFGFDRRDPIEDSGGTNMGPPVPPPSRR